MLDSTPVRKPPGLALGAAIGKTLVSSSMIDRLASKLGRALVEVPVGFKWFVPGLARRLARLRRRRECGRFVLAARGSVWSTDKDGIIMDLLAAEMMALTGQIRRELYAELTRELGAPVYERIDAPATAPQKAAFASALGLRRPSFRARRRPDSIDRDDRAR